MDMAKRKYSKMKKIEPSVQTLTFAIEAKSSDKEFNYIDLSQCASILNRRFYRQGINWAVSSFKILSGAGVTGEISIHKLPNSWVMSNAWEKGFRAWQRQQRDTLEDGTQESVKAKFNDFKIYMNADHLSSGFGNNLLPYSAATSAGPLSNALPGEWEASQIVIPNYGAPGVNYEPYLMAVGNDVGGAGGAFSLIKAYENSRSVPQSPDPVTPGGILNAENIYRAMFDVGDNNEDVLENVVGKNDELPYDQLRYPGGDGQLPSLQIHDTEYITSSTIGGTTRLKGGNFPCGLIEIGTYQLERDDVILIQINMVPGTHRGYLCEPMTEM